MKIRELMTRLADFDQDEEVRVAVELGEVESVSFHDIREIEEGGIGSPGGVELIVCEAGSLFCSPPWLAAALLGET